MSKVITGLNMLLVTGITSSTAGNFRTSRGAMFLLIGVFARRLVLVKAPR